MPTLEDLERVARGGRPAPLEPRRSRRGSPPRAAVVDQALASGSVVYGVTTGIGNLASVRIGADDAAALQLNLVRSHAVGAGPPLPGEVVRGMLALLAASLRRGHSGVREEVVELLLAMLERGVVPVVPSQGLGRLLGRPRAAGPRRARAHRRGRGRASTASGSTAARRWRRAGLEPVALEPKEGLALINGTHLMAAAGGLAARDARRLLDAAVVALALSLEAFKGSTVPFDERLAGVRPHPGAQRVAARLRALLEGSEVVASHADCGRVQDPYTLRCAPQVLGAIDDALGYVEAALERELHAVTDNPLVFPDDGDVVAGGNFHGQPLSLPLDHLALALCELASFSERRTYALLSPSYAELPAVPLAAPGAVVGADAHPVRGRRARQRVPGAGPPGRRRLDPDLGRPGGLQLDGRAGGAEGAHGGRELRAGHRHRARLRLPGPRVPPPAAHHAAARGRRGEGPRRSWRASRRIARSAASWRRWPTRCEPGRSCCEMPGLGAGGCAADAREQPASRRRRAPAGPRRLRRHRQGRARPRARCGRSSASCSASAATRRCSSSRASRWRCSRRTPTRRAC